MTPRRTSSASMRTRTVVTRSATSMDSRWGSCSKRGGEPSGCSTKTLELVAHEFWKRRGSESFLDRGVERLQVVLHDLVENGSFGPAALVAVASLLDELGLLRVTGGDRRVRGCVRWLGHPRRLCMLRASPDTDSGQCYPSPLLPQPVRSGRADSRLHRGHTHLYRASRPRSPGRAADTGVWLDEAGYASAL